MSDEVRITVGKREIVAARNDVRRGRCLVQIHGESARELQREVVRERKQGIGNVPFVCTIDGAILRGCRIVGFDELSGRVEFTHLD